LMRNENNLSFQSMRSITLPVVHIVTILIAESQS
jgi:hypothetical protein